MGQKILTLLKNPGCLWMEVCIKSPSLYRLQTKAKELVSTHLYTNQFWIWWYLSPRLMTNQGWRASSFAQLSMVSGQFSRHNFTHKLTYQCWMQRSSSQEDIKNSTSSLVDHSEIQNPDLMVRMLTLKQFGHTPHWIFFFFFYPYSK